MQETQVSQVELFLNSVPILAPLSRDERLRLVDALEEVTFQAGAKVRSLLCPHGVHYTVAECAMHSMPTHRERTPPDVHLAGHHRGRQG